MDWSWLLRGLRVARCRFRLTPCRPVKQEHYPGFAIRGAFGYALRSLVCLFPERVCSQCEEASNCPYFRLFEYRPAVDEGLFRDKAAPRPFVLDLPFTPCRTIQPGDPFEFDMVLIGSSARWLPHVILGVKRMGEAGFGPGRVPHRLMEARLVGPKGGTVTLFPSSLDKDESFQAGGPLEDFLPDLRTSRGGQLAIVVENYLKLPHPERYTNAFDFEMFGSDCWRRLSNLARLYGDTNGGESFKPERPRTYLKDVRTVQNSLTKEKLVHFSGHQSKLIREEVIVGAVVLEGVSEHAATLLRAGSVLHAGKGTTSGLGRFAVLV